MPYGTVDYRERLRGPGTQDVLGMILRGIAGGSGASEDVTLDPEGAQALRELFGGTATPEPPAAEPEPAPVPVSMLRPDEKAAIVDRLAREVHRKIVAGGGARKYYQQTGVRG